LLYDYLQEGARLTWLVPGPTLDRLRAALPASHRARFDPVLRQLSPTTDDRIKQMAELQALLGAGDPGRGEALFHGKTACGSCHRVGPQGGTVGPDLTKVGAIRSGRDLVESILIPSATFAQGYDVWVVQTKQGDAFSGIRMPSGDETLTLRDASGAELRFDKDQLARVELSPISIMPEGLLGALHTDEIRDLLAFLQSLK
jgi:putative heme-binding domain-containing protein